MQKIIQLTLYREKILSRFYKNKTEAWRCAVSAV